VLVDAALANGVQHFVAESITFLYVDGGSEWLDEHSPVDAGIGLQPVVTLEHEVARFTEAGGIGVALRYGAFYGADARNTDEFLTAAKRRIAPAVGPSTGFVSSIETRDAARATAAALGAPAGVYNVVDDHPLTRRELADAFASAFGLPRLHIPPGFAVRVAGGAAAQALVRSQRVSNAAFKAATGWQPERVSAAEGWQAIAASREASRA
jgi:nucleoside-diphosphate-sugar epimerase